MVNNRTRGRKGENEAASVLRGKRISRTGESGSDIIDGLGRTWECKRIRNWPSYIQKWFRQAESQGDFGVIVRADRQQWFVIIPAERYVKEVMGAEDHD